VRKIKNKKMELVKYITSTIKAWFYDTEALDYIDENVKWYHAFGFIYFLNVVFLVLNYVLNLQKDTIGLFFNPGISLIVSLIFFPIFLFIGLGILHGFFKLFGAKGSFLEGTVKYALSLSILPTFIFSIIEIILQSFLQENSILIGIFIIIIYICFFIWSLSIYLKVYSIVHDISQWRVFFAMFMIPLILIIIFSIIAIFGFQMWFNTYQSELNTKIEEQSSFSSQPMSFERLESNGNIYIKSFLPTEQTIDSLKIKLNEEEFCMEENLKILPGQVNFFTLSCSEPLIIGNAYDVIAVTSTGVYSVNLLSR